MHQLQIKKITGKRLMIKNKKWKQGMCQTDNYPTKEQKTAQFFIQFRSSKKIPHPEAVRILPLNTNEFESPSGIFH